MSWYALNVVLLSIVGNIVMNDFTLEELKLILDDMDDLRFSKFYGPNNIALREKIISMIDSYCEHEKSKTLSDVDYVEICTKCEELTGWV
jgi:hypothetical protein